MCRLAYLNNEAIKMLDVSEIAEFFKYLEKSQGGHGNGIGGLVNNKFVVVKGVNKSAEELARVVKKVKWDNGVIYHTRLASSSSVSDSLCHPFVSLDKKLLLAHNGHFADYDSIIKVLKVLNDVYENYCTSSISYVYDKGQYIAYVTRPENCKEVSDTWVATEWLAFLVKHYGNVEKAVMKFFENYKDTGNYFVMLNNGVVYLLIGSRDFEIYHDNNVIVAGSEGLEMLSVINYDEVKTGDYLIIKISNNDVEVIEGKLRKKRKKGKWWGKWNWCNWWWCQ